MFMGIYVKARLWSRDAQHLSSQDVRTGRDLTEVTTLMSTNQMGEIEVKKG